MSKLYGYLNGDRGQATKSSNQRIDSVVQTQKGRIRVFLNDRGDFSVFQSRSGGNYATGYHGEVEIASGNVDTAGEGRTRGRVSLFGNRRR